MGILQRLQIRLGIARIVVDRLIPQVNLARNAAIQDVIHNRHHIQRHERGVQQAAHNHNRHATLHRRPHGITEHHRQHSEDGGNGRHHDGAHTGTSRRHQSIVLRQATAAQLVHVVNEHDAVIHHRTHKHREAQQRKHAQLFASRHQAEQTAGKGKGNSQDHDEGRKQALELRHHNKVDQHKAQNQQQHHLGKHRVDVFQFATGLDGVALGQLIILELGLQIARKQSIVVAIFDIGRHRNSAG